MVAVHAQLLPGGDFALPEHRYPITIEGASWSVEVIADGPVAIYVQEGLSCGGPESFCLALDQPDPDGEIVGPSLGTITGPALDYVVTIEATDPNGPAISYTLRFLCAVP